MRCLLSEVSSFMGTVGTTSILKKHGWCLAGLSAWSTSQVISAQSSLKPAYFSYSFFLSFFLSFCYFISFSFFLSSLSFFLSLFLSFFLSFLSFFPQWLWFAGIQWFSALRGGNMVLTIDYRPERPFNCALVCWEISPFAVGSNSLTFGE